MTKTPFLVVFLILAALSSHRSVEAQSELICGDIVRAEVTTQQGGEGHLYRIDLAAGDEVSFNVMRVGQSSNPRVRLYDPSGRQIAEDYIAVTERGATSSSIPNFVIPATGSYELSIKEYNNSPMAYVLNVGCVLHTGQEIPPGSALTIQDASHDEGVPNSDSDRLAIPFTGIGYPGVAPVNFADVNLIGLPFGVPITSRVSAQGSGVSGFTIDANQGDVLSISAQRLSGNLGVGFVVFAQPNVPVFIAGPVSASTFSTEIELPQAGSYVIGLFRMGNVPPNAENTDFQITASLIP